MATLLIKYPVSGRTFISGDVEEHASGLFGVINVYEDSTTAKILRTISISEGKAIHTNSGNTTIIRGDNESSIIHKSVSGLVVQLMGMFMSPTGDLSFDRSSIELHNASTSLFGSLSSTLELLSMCNLTCKNGELITRFRDFGGGGDAVETMMYDAKTPDQETIYKAYNSSLVKPLKIEVSNALKPSDKLTGSHNGTQIPTLNNHK